MTPEQISEVWSMLDREQLAAITRQGPEPIFATISGAHLYGFASRDSDVDLRGAFLLPLRSMLGLRRAEETLTIEQKSPIDLDWVAHDLRKFARMMVSHNGYVMEQLFSPLVVVTGPAHQELLELGRGCITRPMVRHYQGFARGRRHRVHEPDATVKHLLYAYRVLLSGIHLMHTGEVVANITSLREHYRLPEVEELVRRKQEGAEVMPLSPGDITTHDRYLDTLEQRLEEAHQKSSLPLEPRTTQALEDFVIRLRVEQRGG
jgi:predicted nucleotidyltransferase